MSYPTPDTCEDLSGVFISEALPWSRPDETAQLNLHWTFAKDSGGEGWWGASFRRADDMLDKLSALKSKTTTRNIFVCMSAQARAGEDSSANSGKRSAATSAYFGGLWLDVDVKEGGYANIGEACDALGAFLTSTSIPKPTLLVKSGGGGLHVHWLFSEVVERSVWEPLAKALAEAGLQNGLSADFACTTDPCRLLRVPDTLNYKYAPPKPVKMVGRVGQRRAAEEWRERLLPWTGSSWQTSRASLLPMQGAATNLPFAPVTHEVIGELGAGIADVLPHWFGRLRADAMGAVISHALSHIDNTKTDPRERWLRVLFAVADAGARGCPDAHDLALDWSRRGAGWTSEEDFEVAWRSAKPGALGGVSVGTLLHMSKAAGADFAPWQAATISEAPQAVLPSAPTALPSALATSAAHKGAINISGLPLVPPKRQWLHGTDMVRGAVSLVVAPGGRGKTSWLIALALACASGRQLLGSHVFGGPLRVLYVNAEDATDEIARRVRAAMRHHQLVDADVAGLQVAGADRLSLTLIKVDRSTPCLDHAGWQALNDEVARCNPDVVVLDPLVALVGGASLNDNASAALLMRELVALAAHKNLAVMIAHHTAKSRDIGSAEAAMGAASIVNLARIGLAVEPLSEGDAGKIGVAPWDAKSIFRIVGTKQNLSPASSSDRWFRLVSVEIPNAEPPTYPAGDAVAVVEVFQQSASATPFPRVMLDAALAAIASAPSALSPSPKSTDYAVPVVAHALAPHRGGRISDNEAKSIIDYLVRTGRIVLSPISVKRHGRGSYPRQGYTVVGPVPHPTSSSTGTTPVASPAASPSLDLATTSTLPKSETP